MKAIVCEMCSSHDVVKQDGMYVCQSCGTKYSTEDARKLMVEVSGTVKVDNSKKLENYYQLARQAKANDNSADAAKYYDLIRQEVPNDWEANFYSVYYTTMQCKVGDIPNASFRLCNSIDSVIAMVNNGLTDQDEIQSALTEIGNHCKTITLLLYTSVWKQYQPNGYLNNPFYFSQKTPSVLSILTVLGDSIEKYFGTDEPYATTVKELRKCDIVTRVDELKTCKQKEYNQITCRLIAKVQEKEPTYVAPPLITNNAKSGGCYVATAVYGSYDCPQVWTLRRYRDETLAATWRGRAFIRTYYAISPTLVKWFGEAAWFKNMWKSRLDRMVERLNTEGVQNTPYEDKEW